MASLLNTIRKITNKSTSSTAITSPITSTNPTTPVPTTSLLSNPPLTHVPVVINLGTYQATSLTAQLLREIGGPHALLRMCMIFYETYMFTDPHTRLFIADLTEPHAQRLAYWITEKMDQQNPIWTQDRAERAKCPIMKIVGKGDTAHQHIVKDRSSAHHAAWFSPLRAEKDQGRRFNLTDSRIWMRLMFLSARQSGLFDNQAFANWYIGFIGHFIAVYERSAPRYARMDAEWSADPVNVQAYLDNGKQMHLLFKNTSITNNTFSNATLANNTLTSSAEEGLQIIFSDSDDDHDDVM